MMRHLVRGTAALATLVFVPAAVHGREAAAFARGDEGVLMPLADRVVQDVTRGVGTEHFHTGSARFDGEWAYGTHVMALLGLAAMVRRDPSLLPQFRPAMAQSAAALVRPASRRFGTDAWGEDALATLDSNRGHAYLGYMALALGAAREVDREFAYGAEHDALVSALARRLFASDTGTLETYPGETYPCDVAFVVGAIALHAQRTGRANAMAEPLAAWERLARERFVDPASGLLRQTFTRGHESRGLPRASGTALAAFALERACPSMSRSLARALQRQERSWLGFGAIAEYASGYEGSGDIDSGLVVFGTSVSATGFALATVADEEVFTRLFRTTHLFGLPSSRGGFETGGPLGNAILLAMLAGRAS